MHDREIKNAKAFKKAQELADAFAEYDGRRPRIMIATMEQNTNESNTKIMATGFADVGFDVDIAPPFQTPQQITKQTVENDVHVLAISPLGTGYKILVKQVIEALKKYNRDDIMIIAVSDIAKKDYQYLFDLGVIAIFNPDSNFSETALSVLELLIDS